MPTAENLLWRTAENVALVRKLRAEGLTYSEIGQRLGVSAGVVRKGNLHGEAKSNQIADETRRAALMMLESGVPQIEVARHFGVTAFSVRAWHNVPRVRPSRAKQSAATRAAHHGGGERNPDIEAAPVPRIKLQLPERVQRMRDSFKARGMPHEEALREAMRICAGSAVDARGGARAAGGDDRSFHGRIMPAGAGD